MAEADDKQKVKLFNYLVGESGRELLDTLMGNIANDAWKIEDIITKFDDHCNPSVNEIAERYRFFMRNQGSRENKNSYLTELRLLAKTANFGTLRESLIRNRHNHERKTHVCNCAEPQSFLRGTLKTIARPMAGACCSRSTVAEER